MKIEKIYEQLKAFDSQLPNMVVGLMRPCSQTYCECRDRVDEGSFVGHCAKKSDNTQSALDGSIKALMSNPNLLLLSQERQKEDSLNSATNTLGAGRIELVELE